MRSRTIPAAALALFAALGPLACGAFAQAAAAAPAAAPAGGASSLAAARAALAKASQAELPARLEAWAAPLSVPDSIALVDEFLPRLGAADRASFLVKTAGLSLLLGGFQEASVRYESASALSQSGRDPVLLLKAGRCALAAGDDQKATELSAFVLAAGADPASTAGARLLGAWALAFRGRGPDALAIATSMLGPGAGPGTVAPALPAELRREARFLAWLCSAKEDKAAAATALASDFPGSPEALVATGAASSPPLPHWYLGALGSLKGRAQAPAAPSAQPTPAASAPPAAAASAAKPTASAASAQPTPAASAPPARSAPVEGLGRLQVGYFSVEDNAKRLAAQLKSKGFAAVIEARPRAAGSSSSAARAATDGDSRWIVLVEAGPDPAATMKSLKDAGFESYGVE